MLTQGGKDLRAFNTSSMDTWMGRERVVGGMKGGSAWGCLASSSLKTSLEGEAMPVDVRHWSAFLYWLSATARQAREMLLRWRDSAEDDFVLDRQVWPPVASTCD